jgi:hypothetical protein
VAVSAVVARGAAGPRATDVWCIGSSPVGGKLGIFSTDFDL